MKRTKRIASVLLALVMALSLITTAFAAGETGSITINNAVVGKTYTIYRIFDLNSHNNDYTAINYKVSTKWAAFFQDGAKGHDYVTIDDQGYVTWKVGADKVKLLRMPMRLRRRAVFRMTARTKRPAVRLSLKI